MSLQYTPTPNTLHRLVGSWVCSPASPLFHFVPDLSSPGRWGESHPPASCPRLGLLTVIQ